MAILNYLPTFKVVEMNRSVGLGMGHILSQYKVDPTSTFTNIAKVTVGASVFVENGVIVGLDTGLTLSNFSMTNHNRPFIVFTEELNTFMDGLKYFANGEDAHGDIYVRAVALYEGDTWTTNNFSGDADKKFAKVVNGVITTQASKDVNTLFAVEASTTPLGETAIRVTYLGIDNGYLAVANTIGGIVEAKLVENDIFDETALATYLDENDYMDEDAVDAKILAHAALTTDVHGLN